MSGFSWEAIDQDDPLLMVELVADSPTRPFLDDQHIQNRLIVGRTTLVVNAAAGSQGQLRDQLAPHRRRFDQRWSASGPYTGPASMPGWLHPQSGDYTANCTGEIALVRVTAGDQNDQVVNSTGVPSSLNGGNGRRHLIGGSRNDTLTGGPARTP